MSISRKQLFALCGLNIVYWTIFNGLNTMLPIYALRLGADPVSIGNYLGFAFFAVGVGAIVGGWLSDRFQRRKTWLAASIILNIFATWLMSQVTSFGSLVIITGIVFFLQTIGFSIIIILIGLSADPTERGKIFGIVGVTGPIGSVVAGSVSGVIINQWGFAALFGGASVCWLLALMILLLVKDVSLAPLESVTTPTVPTLSKLGTSFYIMLAANLVAFSCGFIPGLSRPLQMDGLGFDAEAISGVVAISGLVSIPLPFFLGWLSDRMNRYYVIAAAFVVGAIGLFTLAGSNLLWHFVLSNVLLIGVGGSIGISQALITDLVPPKSLGKALSLYSTAVTFGGVIGFTSTGIAIQTFGMIATYLGGALLTLFAVGLLFLVKSAHRREHVLA